MHASVTPKNTIDRMEKIWLKNGLRMIQISYPSKSARGAQGKTHVKGDIALRSPVIFKTADSDMLADTAQGI